MLRPWQDTSNRDLYDHMAEMYIRYAEPAEVSEDLATDVYSAAYERADLESNKLVIEKRYQRILAVVVKAMRRAA